MSFVISVIRSKDVCGLLPLISLSVECPQMEIDEVRDDYLEID